MANSAYLYDSFTKLKESFSVADRNLAAADIVFILESPHTEELKFGVPVAGASGRMMSKVLFGRTTSWPLGRILIEGAKDIGNPMLDEMKRIGLMNICNIPMQAAAYPEDIQKEYAPFLNILEQIRVKMSANYRVPEMNELREIITVDFLRRLEHLREREIQIVPCGRCASFYFGKARLDDQWDIHEGVPHPSRNQWYQESEAISRLQLLFPAPVV